MGKHPIAAGIEAHINEIRAERDRYREALEKCMEYDGSGSDHISCHGCYDTYEIARQALKGEA